MKRIMVTGGAGYIGSHTCKLLRQRGYEPVVYDNLIYGHRWAVKWGPLEVGDINDAHRLSQVMRTYKPVAVIHFAAFAYVGESVIDPEKYYLNNVLGTLNLLACMRANKIERIIFSSTCASYGLPTELPIAETHVQNPINPYGQSKLMIEKVLADYDRAYALRFVALRYFNAAGADPDGEIGESHEPETHAIPLLLDVASGKRECFTVYGNDYETEDGTCIRDYIHVTDLASAHVLALESLIQGAPSNVYNLGNGMGYSVKQLINCAEQITQTTINVEYGARRAGDPAVLVGDATKIIAELKWLPTFNKLEQIIETAWQWQNQAGKS
ncbi:MAG: UDP-glucose 4-epimerase GalE [Gammaproteobacteria bacterium]|nr:UDP-glucose 4-epimerase GalE [Gammaproteobacteria bacterium]